MHPEGITVRGALYWVACGLIALNLPLSIGRAVATPTAYRAGFASGVLILLSGLLAWALRRCAHGVDAALPLQGIAVASCIALVLHRWTLGPGVDSYPPLLHVLGAGMCISSVLGVRVAFGLIPLFAIQVAVIRSPFMDVQSAFAEASLLGLSGWVTTAIVQVLQRAGRTVDDAVAATVRLEEDALRARRRAFERERWNGLVHDKVLGALQLAVRHTDGHVPQAARDLAEQALAAFQGDPASFARPAAATWQEQAERLGLQIALLTTGEVSDPDVKEAVVEAVNEALTNVARHSGQTTATISGAMSGSHATLVISDPGLGFLIDPNLFRTGIRSSIQGRMHAVSGTATVDSSPGAGTRVTLSWDAHQPVRGPTPSDWQLRTFAPMMALGGCVVALNVFMGRSHWETRTHPIVALLGIAAVVIVTALATFIEPTSRQGASLVVGMAAVAVCLAADTPTGAPFAWRYWYLGALTPAVGALAFRYPRGTGLVGAAAVSCGVGLVDLLAGRPALACLTGPVPVMIATAIAGHLLRAAMDKTWLQVAHSASQEADLRLAIAVQEVRSQEAAARVSMLQSTVGPALQELANTERIQPRRARQLALLEGATRDQLTAPDLLDDTLMSAVRDARARGIRIEIVGTGIPGSAQGDASAPDLALFRSLLTHLLHRAAPPLRVRVIWRPHHGASLDQAGTITAVGTSAKRLGDHLRQVNLRTDEQRRALITSDDEWLLIDFSPATIQN